MSQFITLEDYDASIHREILDALLRHDSDVQDSAIIEICEDRAIEEMRGYMDKFYNCDAIFNRTRFPRYARTGTRGPSNGSRRWPPEKSPSPTRPGSPKSSRRRTPPGKSDPMNSDPHTFSK